MQHLFNVNTFKVVLHKNAANPDSAVVYSDFIHVTVSKSGSCFVLTTLSFAGVYSLGKESLIHELALEFKTWVEVSFERMETLKALGLPDVFTTEPGAGRIRAVEQSQVSFAALQQWNKERLTLAILPTSRPLISFHPNIHVVPYSDHSSYQELEDFVSALKPSSVVPIVGSFLPGSLSALLPQKKRHEILVPESVRHYMLRQTERRLSSSTYAGFCRRMLRPLAPKGVLFCSPAKGSVTPCEEDWEADGVEPDGSEEDMDTGSCERDSDCILVDPSVKLTPDKSRGAGDEWSLNFVQTVPQEFVRAESVPLSQLTRSSLAPVEIPTHTETVSKLGCATRKHFNAKIMDQHQEAGEAENSQVMDEDALSEHSGSDQNSSDRTSCAPYSSSKVLRREYIERLENSLLEHLPFSEEDFKLGL